MFQFRRFPTYAYFIQRMLTEYCSAGFPHSEISGSKLICSSPKLIAAYRVLHRLLMPRHSPCALYSLTYSYKVHFWILYAVIVRIMQAPKKKLFLLLVNCNFLYYPLSLKLKFFLLLLPSIIYWINNLQCSVFKVHPVEFQTFVQCSLKSSVEDFNQHWCAVLYYSDVMCCSVFRLVGGPKWTRTTDLTIISRVL